MFGKRKIVLTLGGGSAYGFAHVGVLKALEEAGLKPAAVGGTSMGALIGAFYAAGYNASDIIYIAKKIDLPAIAKLFMPSLPRGGLVRNGGVRDFLKRFLGDIKIEELNIPFFCIATDIINSEELIFTEGSLVEAVLSSISIPILFEPNYYQGRCLLDGGLKNNVPSDVAEVFGDYVISVNVLTAFNPDDGEKKKERLKEIKEQLKRRGNAQNESDSSSAASNKEELKRTTEDAVNAVKSMPEHAQGLSKIINDVKEEFKNKSKSPGINEVIARTVSIATEDLTRLRGYSKNNHSRINLRLEDYRLFDFMKAEELINCGYEQAKGFIPLFERLK